MAIRSLIKEVALLLYVIGISQAERDLLDTIHLNADNPPEVNDFLHEVLQFRNDFRWIRRQAQDSEINNNQVKKSIFMTPSNQMDFLNEKDTSQNIMFNDASQNTYDVNKMQNQPIYNLRRPIRRSGRNLRKRKRKRRKSGLVRRRRSKGSVNLDLNNEQDSNGEVKIVPRSETGVQNVPGQKYYGRHRKSSDSSETCLNPDHNDHNVVWTRNKTSNDTGHDTGEYYYTSPHDLLGLAQDMVGGSKDLNKNHSCTASLKKTALISGRPCRNISNPGGPQQIKSFNTLIQQNPVKLTQPPVLSQSQFTLPSPRYFPQQSQSASALNSPPPRNFPSFDSYTSLKSTTSKFMPDLRNNDFIKLVNYIETPSKENQIPSKQELLRKDSDNLLENIDHVLKADRTGLHMDQAMAQPQRIKEDDYISSTEKEMYKSFDVASYNHPMLQNIMSPRRILPLKIGYNYGNINKRIRSVNKRDVDDDEVHVPNVELKFNSHPIQKFKPKKPTSKRRASSNKKKKKKSNRHFPFLSSDPTTSTTTMILPSAGLMLTISSTSNSMVNNPNVKLLENADDDNNKNLKMTLKEYINRENAHNLEKQQQEQEDEDNTFDYNVGQEKKIELEDLTEPTSAAEQRELGRKDDPATPSINNDDNDNQFIVVPLKKQVPVDVMGYRSADFETMNSLESFRVKDSEDVIHLGKKSNTNKEFKKNSDLDEKVIEKDQKRSVITKKEKELIDNPSILNLENDQFYYENNQGKLSPIKQMDYNYYDNFEQKREIPKNFKSRKLQNEENNYYYYDSLPTNYIVNNDYDSSLNIQKRSEDDEPDEEPGNDAKEPHYKQKKVQENEPLDLSPKVEETETLHIDVIDPKRRSFNYNQNKIEGFNKRRSNKNQDAGKNATGAIAISITTIDDFQVSDENNGEKIAKHMKKNEEKSSTERCSNAKKKTKPTTCDSQESDGESNEDERSTEESKSNSDSNDQSTCILISAKPVTLADEELEKYREKSRKPTESIDENGEEEETETTRSFKKKKFKSKTKFRDEDDSNITNENEAPKKMMKGRKKLNEEVKYTKHRKHGGDDDRQLLYCYVDKNKKNKKIHNKHIIRDDDDDDDVKAKVVVRRIKSKDENDDNDAEEKEDNAKDKNNYSDKFEKYKYDKYDDGRGNDDDEEDDDKDKEMIDERNDKDDEEEKEDRDEKDDKEEFNMKNDENDYHKAKKVTQHKHGKKVIKHRRPYKEDVVEEYEPEVIYKHSKKNKKFNRPKFNNDDEENDVVRKVKFYDDQPSGIGSKEDDDPDFYTAVTEKRAIILTDDESGVTVYQSKPRQRSPTMNQQDRNGTKVISTTCHLENVVTGSMGLIECLQEQAQHSECESNDETPPNEENQETSESLDEAEQNDLEVKDSELKDSELKDGEHKDSELKDGEHKNSELKDGEHKDSELKDGEHKDSELKDGEHKDSELKDGEHKDSELKDGEHKDGEHKDSELKDGEHKDSELKDGEYKDSELKDGEHKDSVLKDLEHKDSELKDGEHKDSELKDGEHKDGEHRNGDHKDAEHKDAEYKNAEHEGVEHKDAEILEAEHKDEEYKDADHKNAEHKNEEHKDAETLEAEHKNEEHKDAETLKAEHKNEGHKDAETLKAEHKHEEHKDAEHKDTEHKDTEHKDSEHNDAEHKDKEHKNEEHKDTDHKEAEHKDVQHKNEELNNAEHNDAEPQDSQSKNAESQDAESKDSELNDAESKDAQPQDSESKDAEPQDAESKDSELNDSESKDAEPADAESQNAESQDAESQDAKSQNVESQDAKSQDAESQDAISQDNFDQDNASEVSKPRPVGEKVSAGEVKSSEPAAAMRGEGKTYELPKNENHEELKEETGGILEDENEQKASTTNGNNSINYNYFNVTINMISNGVSENPDEEGSDENGNKPPKVVDDHDQELQQLTKNIIELIKKGKYCNSPSGHTIKEHQNDTFGGGRAESSGEEINQGEASGGNEQNENKVDAEETKTVDDKIEDGKIDDVTEGDKESEDTQENGDYTTESKEDTEQTDTINAEDADTENAGKNRTEPSKPIGGDEPKKAQAAKTIGHDETGAAYKSKVDQMRKKGHQEDHTKEKETDAHCGTDKSEPKEEDEETTKNPSEEDKSETDEENKDDDEKKEGGESNENADNDEIKENENAKEEEPSKDKNESDDEADKDLQEEKDKNKKPKQDQAVSAGESPKDESSSSQAAFKANQPASQDIKSASGASNTLTLNASATLQCDNNTFESIHKEPLKAQSSPLREDPVEDNDLLISEPKTNKKPILIKSSTVVHIGNKPGGLQTSTQDSDDVFPQNIGEDDIKDIITSRESDKLALSLIPRPQSLEELSEEEILENDQRNVMVKNPERNQQILAEDLMSRYKNRFTPRRQINQYVHHHTEKKHGKQIPKDPCIKEGYYNDLLKREALEDLLRLNQKKRQTKSSDHLDDNQYYYERYPPKRNVIIPVANAAEEEAVQRDTQKLSPDDLEYYHEKRIMKNSLLPVIRPAKEAYMDIESVDEDLKEKLLFQKVYDSVMRSRKKAHMYKSLDEYFENASIQDDDDPVCPVDDNLDNIEIPTIRKQEYEHQKEKDDEDSTPDTGGGLVDVSRPKKKIDNKKKIKKKKVFDDLIDISKNSYENLDDLDGTSTESSKIKLDDVESFKDVIEQPSSFNSKRSTLGRQLKNLESESNYLSPILEDDDGEQNIRLRRKLRNLRQFTRQASPSQLNRILPFNYNDYIQNHRQESSRFGQNLERSNNPGDVANFRDSQTPQNGNQEASQGNEIATDVSDSSNSVTDNPGLTTQAAVCEEVSNRSRGIDEEEQKKKEREDMRNMLNGDLPMNLLNIFYGKLKDNSGLFSRFGGSISSSKECAYENVMNIKTFREDQAKIDIKHAEEMLHEVIVMLNRIVADQVHRKTCLKLSPNLKLYIIRITKGMRNFKKSSQIAEGYPLPKIKYRSNQEVTPPPEEEQGHLLFEEPGDEHHSQENPEQEKEEIKKRMKLIQKLLEKYERMSMKCQVQVAPVRKYLIEHLQMLTELLEKSKSGSSSISCSNNGENVPKEPPISEEELAAPNQHKMVANFQPENNQMEFTTILQRSIQLNKDPNSELAHRQQVLIETQQDQRKIEDSYQYISEHQNSNDNPSTQIHDDIHNADKDLPFKDSKDYNNFKRADLNNIQLLPYSGNVVGLSNSVSEGPRSEVQIRCQPGNASPSGSAGSGGSNGSNGSAGSNGSPGLLGSPGSNGSPLSLGSNGSPGSVVGGSSDQIKNVNEQGPPQNGQQQLTTPGAPSEATNNPGNPAEDTTHYSYPDLVTKDLMQLGLGGANTYLPPFSVDGMVKENMMKMNNIGNQQQGAGGGIELPNPTAPQHLSPQNLQRIIQTSFASPSSVIVSPKYQPKPRSDTQEINEILNPVSRSLIVPREASTSAHRDPSLKEKQRFKRVTNDDSEEDSNEEASSKIRKLALNLYQDPQNDFDERNSKSLRSTIHSHLFNEAHVVKSDVNVGKTTMEDDESEHNTENDVMIKKPIHDEAYFVSKPRREFSPKNTNWTGTDKYKKLVEAYESLRDKRQNEDRFSRMYANKDDDKLILKAANKQMQDISKVNFEKPLVFSLD